MFNAGKTLLVVFGTIFITSCATPSSQPAPISPSIIESNLSEFAHANCLYWYFLGKGYDTADIKAVAGGLVETGTAPAEAYEEIALAVKKFRPTVETKQNIDTDLLRCFMLDKNESLQSIIDRYTGP